MPLYEYQCAKCGKRTEKIENVSGPHLKKCPHCGGKVERMMSAPAIQFKGSGWYVTDYAGKSSAKEAGQTDSSGSDSSKESPAKDSAAKESTAKESTAKESASKESKDKTPAKKK